MPKMELTTTLNAIFAHRPCGSGWSTLLSGLNKTGTDDETLPLRRILDTNNFMDAVWALRAVSGHDNAIRLFACYCARYSLPIFERAYPDDKRPRQAIETAERFARGQATKDELVAAESAAFFAAESAAESAAWAAAWAADTAGCPDAVWCAAGWAAKATDEPDAARTAAVSNFQKEFIRLCNHEGEYGEVDIPRQEAKQ